MKRLRALVITYISLLVSTLSWSQTNHFKQINIEQGLIQSQAYTFIQDQRDFMWIATLGGITIYDGTSFQYLTKENGLSENTITTLFKDSKETIWIATEHHIANFDGKQINAVPIVNDTFKNNGSLNTFFLEFNHELYLIKDGCLFYLQNGKFNLIIAAGGLHLINGYTVYNKQLHLLYIDQGLVRYSPTQKTQKATDHVPDILSINLFQADQSAGKYIITTNQGIFNFNFNSQRLVKDTFLSQVLGNDILLKYYKDSKGSIWLSTNRGGVFQIDKQKAVKYFDASSGFTNLEVNDIKEDNQNNIWLSTNGDGIFRYSYSPISFYNKNKYFNGELITGVKYIHKTQQLYIATHKGNLYETPLGELYNFTPKKHFRGITKLDQDKEGNLMIVTTSEGVYVLENNAFKRKLLGIKGSGYISAYTSFNHAEALLLNNYLYVKRGNDWTNTQTSFNAQRLKYINDSTLCIGTSNGLYFYNIIQNKTLKTIAQNCYIYDIILHQNKLFIATDDNGLLIHNLSSNITDTISREQGLSCNFIYNMILAQNNLWLGTGCGIDKVSLTKGASEVQNYSAMYGLAAVEANAGAIASVEDKIFVGTNNGLYAIDIKTNHQKQFNPKIILKNILVFSKQKDLTPYSDTFLYNSSIPFNPIFPTHFTHLSFDIKAVLLGVENKKYKYQLLGSNDNHIYETNQSPIVFSNLSSGKYQLKVWSTNSNGQWDGTPFLYDFEIQTPFYKTWYFIVAALLFLLSFYFLTLYYLNLQKARRIEREMLLKQEEQDRVKQRTAEDFHDEIGNKLTKINLLTSMAKAQKNNVTALEATLNQLQEQTQSLYQGAKDIIWSLQPQSQYLHEVVERIIINAQELMQLSQIELEVSKNFETDRDYDRYKAIKMDHEVNRNMMLIFKEIFNNISKYSQADKVVFRIGISAHFLKCTIEDNGIGFDLKQNSNTGNGLKNMQRRAARIHAHFSIQSERQKGTSISFVIHTKR